MTAQYNAAPQALHDPGLLEEVQFLDHRIRFRPTQSGWVSFVVRQGHPPTILLAPDRETLIAESHKLIERRTQERR
jgi:hypothetical protein